jgi:hypothetical protein
LPGRAGPRPDLTPPKFVGGDLVSALMIYVALEDIKYSRPIIFVNNGVGSLLTL